VRPPRFDEWTLPEWIPTSFTRALFYVADRLIVDPIFATEFNRFRASLGLQPMRRMFGDWLHRADIVVGLFPEWFAERQADWPQNLWLTGFPLFDGASDSLLPSDVEDFLDAGAPPVVFTAGTAAANEKRFFEESAEACRIAGVRGIFLTKYRDQIETALPEAVRHVDFVPFSRILPRARALVHHGGIGTASQALAAGTPQLVRPLAYDQFDNAARLEGLGVARTLFPKKYRASTIASALEELSSESTGSACQAIRAKLESRDAVSTACDVILRELG
jgi:UDP:flavonoid glycosyltransferase YjiC (YdhE family)